MSNATTERWDQDRQVLHELARQHPWLTVRDGEEEPGYARPLHVQCRGQGLASGGPPSDQYQLADRHEMQWLLPEDYPGTTPQVRMLTPVFHPNISPDGIIAMTDIGIAWESKLTIDIVIERIWNLIRAASFDLENAINPAAARWYADQTGLEFPLDARSLSLERPLSNIVSYRHKRRRRKQPARPRDPSVMVIDDRAGGNDGIHFIE